MKRFHNHYLEDLEMVVKGKVVMEMGEKVKVVREMGVREFQNMIPYYSESRTEQMWFWHILQDSRQEHIHCPN
jgi:hypothetical protein